MREDIIFGPAQEIEFGPDRDKIETGSGKAFATFALQHLIEPGLKLWRDVGGDDRGIVFVAKVEDMADAVDLGKECGFGVWNSKLDAHSPGAKANFQFLKKGIHSLSSAR